MYVMCVYTFIFWYDNKIVNYLQDVETTVVLLMIRRTELSPSRSMREMSIKSTTSTRSLLRFLFVVTILINHAELVYSGSSLL